MDRDASLSALVQLAAIIPAFNPSQPLILLHRKRFPARRLLGLVLRHPNPKRTALQATQGRPLPQETFRSGSDYQQELDAVLPDHRLARFLACRKRMMESSVNDLLI